MNLKAKKIIVFLGTLFLSTLVFAEVKVISITGKCEYEKNSVWEALTVGQVLAEGTKIQTGFKSELVLSLVSNNEDSKLTVAPLSRMTIAQLLSTDKMDKTNVFMDTGSVKSEINKTGTNKVNFTIRSPVATASVRGTVIVCKSVVGGTSFQTERGRMAVWPSSENDEENLLNSENEIQFPKKAMEVEKFQEVELSDSGDKKDTLETASGKAKKLPTLPVASEEEVNSLVEDTTTIAPGKNERGSLLVSVDWE